MSIYLQEVLGLLKRSKKQVKLDKKRDWFEFAKIYSNSFLNTGAAYNPKGEPFIIKWGDLRCDLLFGVIVQDPSTPATKYRIPMYTDPSGVCATLNTSIKDSIMIQNAVADSIIVNGNLNVDENLQVDKNSVLKLNNTLGTLNDTTKFTALLNVVHDSTGAAAGAENRVLRSRADGRVLWSDDDPVVTLAYGNIWVGNSSNIQTATPPGTAGQLIVSNGTTVAYQSIQASATNNLLGGNVVSTGSTIAVGVTVHSLVDLGANVQGADELLIYDSSATQNKRVQVTDLVSSMNVVTGSGVATRVAFWDSTSSLSSDSRLYWHNSDDCLAIGAAPTSTSNVALHLQNPSDAVTALIMKSSVNDVASITNALRFHDGLGSTQLKNEIQTVGTSGTSQGASAMRFIQHHLGTTTTAINIEDGKVGINMSTAPSQELHVTGDVRVTGGIYDSSNDIGSAGQILSSTGSGTNWIAAGAGTISTIQEGAGITVTNGTGPTATVAVDYAGADNMILETSVATPVAADDMMIFNDLTDNTVKRASIATIVGAGGFSGFDIKGDGGSAVTISSGETINFVGDAGLNVAATSANPNPVTISLDTVGTDNYIEVNTAATPLASDYIVFSDVSDSNTIRKSLISGLPFNNLTTLNLSLTTGQTTPFAGSISGSNLNLSLNKFGGGNVVGYVPDSSASAQSTTFLRADGTWQVPAGGGGSTTVSEGAGISVTGTASNPIVAIDYLGSDNAILEASTADPAGVDFLWFSDTSDSGNIKKEVLSKFLTQGSFIVTDGSSPQTIALGDTLTVAAANQASTFGGLTVNTTTADTITIGVDIAGTDNLIMARATESNPATLDYYMFSDTSDGNTLKKQQIYLMPGYYAGFWTRGDNLGTGSGLSTPTDSEVVIAGGTGLTSVATTAGSSPKVNTVTINHSASITAGTAAYPASISYNASGHITAITPGSAAPAGTVTSVTAGEGLELEAGSATVNPTIGVDYTGADNIILVPGAGSADPADQILFNDVSDSNAVKKSAISALPIVTALTAGTGCSEAGGGTTGSLTLNVGAGAGLQANANDLAVDYVGTDSIIQSATSASGVAPDGSDLVIFQDVSDSNTVKYTEVKNLVAQDPGPADYFSFNDSGIVNQGDSIYAGSPEHAVSYASGSGLYTITFATTRPNANYIPQTTIFNNAGQDMMQCRTRSMTTTGFLLEVIKATNTVVTGSTSFTVAVTIYQ
tara:strand:- start:431 stop:4087 length:3657 start_codon:yes stop_codon:yes gene_type:complete